MLGIVLSPIPIFSPAIFDSNFLFHLRQLVVSWYQTFKTTSSVMFLVRLRLFSDYQVGQFEAINARHISGYCRVSGDLISQKNCSKLRGGMFLVYFILCQVRNISLCSVHSGEETRFFKRKHYYLDFKRQ